MKRLPVQPTESDICRWYHHLQYSTSASQITDAESTLRVALSSKIQERLCRVQWRTEAVDMQPVELGIGSFLLPAIPLKFLLSSFRNKKDQHVILLEDLPSLKELTGMSVTRFAWG